MKIQHYVLIFLGLCFGLFVFYRIQNQFSVTYQEKNTEYTNALASACYDAAKTIKVSNLSDNDGVWKSEEDIRYSLDIFFETLSRNFGSIKELLEDNIKDITPFVFLVDIDGFYVSFNGIYDEFGNAIVSSAYDKKNIISSLNTWTENKGPNIVRYYLNDYVQVTASNNRLYEGDRITVYNELASAGVLTSDLSYLNNKAEFDEARDHIVTSKLEEQLNYYANTQLINVGRNFTGYNLTLSEAKGESWSRSIKNPSIIAFIQGPQKRIGGKTYNIYAFAGGEMTNKTMYFIEGSLYYPYQGNVQETVTTTVMNGVPIEVTTYTHNGVVVDNCYTLEQCVELGATPGF